MFKGPILLALLFFIRIGTATAEPTVDVIASATEINLNETVTLSLVIEWPKTEADYAFLLPTFTPKNLTVERQGESQETFLRDGAEWLRKTFSIELKPIAIGTGRVGSFRLGYIEPSSQKGGSYTVAEQNFLIKKPPFKFVLPKFVIVITVSTVAMVTITVVFLKLKSHKKQVFIPEHQQRLTRYKEEISKADPGAGKEFLQTWSLSLRQAVGELYGLGTGSFTENEVARALAKKDVPRDEIEKVSSLFNRLHEAKFSGSGLAHHDLRRLQVDLIDFIQGKQVV